MYQTIRIKNFFDNPYEIIEYSKSLKFYKPDKSKSNQGWPGVRTESLHMINPKLFSTVLQKILLYYFINENYKITAKLYFHKSNKETSLNYNKINSIHTDFEAKIAGLIYLNDGNDINSGTALYDQNNKETVIFSNSFNTMISYDANEKHGPTSLEKDRLTMPFFIEKIERNNNEF